MIRASHKAQITIFMILGIIILFVLVMTLNAGKKIVLSDIGLEKEGVFTKALGKESIRLYIEDCLNDQLEEGLLLIGRQGRLWYDQPGGVKGFEEGISGVILDDERIYYGIDNNLQSYEKNINAYPCFTDQDNPFFCKYSYPNTSEEITFGTLNMRINTLENDLKRYLVDRTIWCVENYTQSNLTQKTIVNSSGLEIKLNIKGEGIRVNVNYPLLIEMQDEQISHKFTFDFFYPTEIKNFLDSAIMRPLIFDQSNIDFHYTNEQLSNRTFSYKSKENLSSTCVPDGDYFTCSKSLFSSTYNSLVERMDIRVLERGDTVYEFYSPNLLEGGKPYLYRIAIQNRPPALDYIGRKECLEGAKTYDYLVVEDDLELGTISIIPSANDPDDDNITKSIITANELALKYPTFFNNPKIELDNSQVKLIDNGLYLFRVNATDEHGLSDWQELRMLKDRPVELSLSINYPYKIYYNESLHNYSELFYNREMQWLSDEDPIFLDLILPEKSFGAPVEFTNIIYKRDGIYKLNDSISSSLSGAYCFDYSEGNRKQSCNLDNYDITLFNNNLFSSINEKGVLGAYYGAYYCNNDYLNKSTEILTTIKQCIPHVNPTHPFPYPYQDYVCDVKETGAVDYDSCKKSDESINPFLATHSCCNDIDWTVKEEDTVCFQQKTCIDDKGKETMLLYDRLAYCDQGRGNICGSYKTVQYKDNNLAVCGSDNYEGCQKIPIECQSQNPYRINNNVWCYGEYYGCEKACKGYIISTSSFDIENTINNADCSVTCPEESYCYDLNKKVYGKCEAGKCVPQ